MLQAYKVPQFDKRLAKEIEFRGGEGTIDQTSYVAPEALRRMMKRLDCLISLTDLICFVVTLSNDVEAKEISLKVICKSIS